MVLFAVVLKDLIEVEYMRYCKLETGQEDMVSDLIWEVFQKFEAPDYPEEGIQTFKSFIEPDNLKSLIKDGWPFYCCFDHDELAGVLTFRGNSHISLLFVKEKYHRQGIAKILLDIALQELLASDESITEITVNSSPYAKTIYEKMGFAATDSLQQRDGILFVPMVKYC